MRAYTVPKHQHWKKFEYTLFCSVNPNNTWPLLHCNGVPPRKTNTNSHTCSETKDQNMLRDNTQWSINDKSHSFLHPSSPLFIPVCQWVNVIGCGWVEWEQSKGWGGGVGVRSCARQSSPIRLILEWRGKQRLPRQQLAGDLTKKARKGVGGWWVVVGQQLIYSVFLTGCG